MSPRRRASPLRIQPARTTRLSNYEHDDFLPTVYNVEPRAGQPSQAAHFAPVDYLWLERYLPYEPQLEGLRHYFIRFK